MTSPPPLTINREGGMITMRWPAWAGGYALQECADLKAGIWNGIQSRPDSDGVTASVTVSLDIASGARFYRLAQP
jgi:hypothetical protein